MIRKRHLALGNKGLAVNSIQMLLLQLAPNAGFSKKVYTVVLAWRKRSIPTHSEWLYPLTFDAGNGLKEA